MNNVVPQNRNVQSYPKMSGVIPPRPPQQPVYMGPNAMGGQPINQPQYYNPYGYPTYPQQQLPPQQRYYPQDPAIEKAAELSQVRALANRYAREGFNSWGSVIFTPRPEDFSFSTQDKGEEIFILMRSHWTSNLIWILRNIFFGLIPIFITFILQLTNTEISFIAPKGMLLLLLMYYSLIISNIFRLFFDWYFDPYIITSDRILHYRFTPFSNYKIREVDMQEITTIEERSGGLISNIFHYGDIGITGEGDVEELVIKRVSSPTKVRDIISDLVNVAKKYNG
jgi:hypothetical protein